MDSIEFLSQYKLSTNNIVSLIASAKWFENQCSFDSSKYWNGEQTHLNEVMITICAYIAADDLIGRSKVSNSNREHFDWYYILMSKLNLQTLNSVLNLIEKKSYFDCFSILRNYQARVLEMLYISIEPEKTNIWMKDHKNKIFREENIRDFLTIRNITTLEHLYQIGNDITHTNYEGLRDLGFEEKGICPFIPFTENQVYVLLKLFACISGYIATTVLNISKEEENISLRSEIIELTNLFEFISAKFMKPGDSRHLWLLFVEDRHYKPNSKGEAVIAQWFNFSKYQTLITELYQKKSNNCFNLTRLLSQFVLSRFARHKLRQCTPRRLSKCYVDAYGARLLRIRIVTDWLLSKE